MDDRDNYDWVDITTLEDHYEVQMHIHSSPSRYRYRRQNVAEWTYGKPPRRAERG